jgi:hypothetical protein
MTQKLVSFLAFTLSLSFFIASAEAIIWSKRSWTLEHNADSFAHDVAMACLTTKSSTITTSGNEIILQDDKACGDDLQSLSLNWDKDTTVPLKSINTVRRDSDKMNAELSEKFKNSTPAELTVLPKSHCPCLILQGSQAKDAIAFLRQQFGSAKQGSTPLKFQLHPKTSTAPTP